VAVVESAAHRWSGGTARGCRRLDIKRPGGAQEGDETEAHIGSPHPTIMHKEKPSPWRPECSHVQTEGAYHDVWQKRRLCRPLSLPRMHCKRLSSGRLSGLGGGGARQLVPCIDHR
jgi:hypothetical protein